MRFLSLLTVFLCVAPSAAQTLYLGRGGAAAVDEIWSVDVPTGTAAAVVADFEMNGAAWDPIGERLLMTPQILFDQHQLYEWRPGDPAPTFLGDIQGPMGDLGIFGLAWSDGGLYGVHPIDNAEGEEGLYSIDVGTLQATLVVDYDLTPDPPPPLTPIGLLGIDGDPDTGTIYGLDELNREIVAFDLGGGVLQTVASYPPGLDDVDGLAACGDGLLYLVPDSSPDAQDIAVFDLDGGVYLDPLASPLPVLDPEDPATVTGAACIAALPPVIEVPTASTAGLSILFLLLATAGVVAVRRL